jgi:hypothetical protein
MDVPQLLQGDRNNAEQRAFHSMLMPGLAFAACLLRQRCHQQAKGKGPRGSRKQAAEGPRTTDSSTRPPGVCSRIVMLGSPRPRMRDSALCKS